MREKLFSISVRRLFPPVKFCFLIMVSLVLLIGNARADITSLTLQPTPDIASFSIDIAYNAASHTFAANGMATCIAIGSPDDPIVFDESSLTMGTFLISATVNNAGVASSGSLTIGGKVLGYGSTGPLLTANNLSFFNSFFTDTLNPDMDVAMFEFLFDVSGGEMADMFGGAGAKVGVIIGYTGVGPDVTQNQFTANFDDLFGHTFGEGWGTSCADVAQPIPEPATLFLLAAGAAAVLRRRK